MLSSPGRRLIRRVVPISLAVLTVALTAAGAAQELPAQLREIDPAGLRGACLLCGSEVTAGQLLSELETAGRGRSRYVLVVGAAPAGIDLSALQRQATVGVVHWSSRWEQVDWSRLNVPQDAIVWLHSSPTVSSLAASRQKLLGWLTELAERDVPCIFSGSIVKELCELRMQRAADAVEIVPGLGLLRGIIDRTGVDGSTAPKTAGQVQWQLDPTAQVWIRGRDLRVSDASGGGVSIWLPGDAAKPAPSLRIDRDHPADLTMLRRAAVLRGAAAFPAAHVRTPVLGSGTLVIVGGGKIPQTAHERFLEIAGGVQSRIVVIPTAGDRPNYEDHRDAEQFRAAGALQVTILHTRDRTAAAGEQFFAALESATGVWFSGGRQWRLVDAYEGTPVVTACQRVLKRGGVIGGSSAGATILGEFLVRGHPLGNEVMMAEGYERGFGFLPGTAIDQHFTQRHREADLDLVHRTHPQLTCVGIDEGTALIVTGSHATVHGTGTVTVLRPHPDSGSSAVAERTLLQPGDSFDLVTRQLPHHATERRQP